MLRQKLQCDADLGIVTYNWIKRHRGPHPNFNVEHKCRNFEAAREFASIHQVNVSSLPYPYFLRPETEPWVEFSKAPFDPLADE